ncbi:hypothetical protein ElyMa_001093500 [Elysia marginata]|uniref:Uncharacterized protein n=1 Tax=Elysia marginata TaxID=1093978 RepID=A0AAV4HSX3_9GAST|nr:hypothetical protein ElyMa_001093500 [Elysia marginata]
MQEVIYYTQLIPRVSRTRINSPPKHELALLILTNPKPPAIFFVSWTIRVSNIITFDLINNSMSAADFKERIQYQKMSKSCKIHWWWFARRRKRRRRRRRRRGRRRKKEEEEEEEDVDISLFTA